MLNAYKIGVTISLINHVSPTLSRIITDFARTDAEANKLQQRIDKIHSGFMKSFAAIGAGAALAAPFKVGVEHAEKFERAMLRIKNIGGMDAASVSGVRADALSGKFKGIEATETVDLFRDLHAAFGHTKEAREFLPQFAEFARVTQAMYGKSAVAGEEDVRALAKLAERRGGTKGPQAMAEQLDLAMRIQNASGGAVTPKDLLAFQTRMGAMGIGMSNDGFAKMWALMQEQGGSKAGTALNSALQNLVNGRGTEASGHVLRKIGWIDDAANQKNLKEIYGDKWSQHLNKVTANALKNSDLAKSDMVGWVQTTGLPLVEKYVDKMGITDQKQRQATITSLLAQGLSNRLGADSISLITTQLDRILKDHGIFGASKGLDETGKNLNSNPLGSIQDMHARWETALVNLGESALPVVVPLVEKLADAFKWFNEYAQKNPATIERITAAILGLSGVLITGGVVGVILNTASSFGLLKDSLLLASKRNAIGGVTAGVTELVSSTAGAGSKLSSVASGLGALTAAAGVFAAAYAGWKIGGMANDHLVNPAVRTLTGDKNQTWGGWIYDKTHVTDLNDKRFGKIAWQRLLPMTPIWGLMGMDAKANVLQREWGVGNGSGGRAKPERQPLPPLWATHPVTQSVAPGALVMPSPIATKEAPAPISISIPQPKQQPVQVSSTINLDGRQIANVVTNHQAREAARPGAGAARFDPTMSAPSVGLAFSR